MLRLIRYLLLPFSIIYSIITWSRNKLYDLNLLKSKSFDLPIVVIGNLALGGTGKSPMVEHILHIVNPLIKVTVLSRGYGRKTKGFRYVHETDEAINVGDEPLQIKRKFKENTVVVCENRVHAIEKIKNKTDAVLLDDAYQHRKLKPTFSILLFDYYSLNKPIITLPTGNFRDTLLESKRADIIVVTKSPSEINEVTKKNIVNRLKKHSDAPIFFSEITYQTLLTSSKQETDIRFFLEYHAILLTGIANPAPLYEYLVEKVKSITTIKFPDHHVFSEKDLLKIEHLFDNLPSKKIIITTEKDIQRLPQDFVLKLPTYYIPIQQNILFNQSEEFNSLIKKAFLDQ